MPTYGRIASIQELAEALYAVLDANAQQDADLRAEWRPDPPTVILTPWEMLRRGLEHLIANEAQIAREEQGA